ncbi:MAG: choice-of-anchor D domain-containing protein, partial [Ktedonobacteraceae bacterium]|nr:choice-of-anchor D domain-containing protein [Ktedonobacteraceae bacterium]
VGASCTVTVTFTPTATSTRAGSLTFIDNASDSAEQAVLSGTGVAANPGVTLNPSNLSFGNQNIGTTSAAQTTTLTNKSASALAISGIAITGTNASDFAQTNTCPSSLASKASCTINVTFTPQDSSVDARTASIAITDNGPASPQTVTLSGTGVTANSGVQLSSTLLNFGNQNNGTTSNAQSVTLTNNGNAALAISSIAVTGTNAGDFTQANTCPVSPSTLAVQASCTISVSFTPTVSGARNATITITDNTDGEGEATQTITLSGTGVSTTTTTYFTDGFESGDFSQWTGGTSGAGAATVQSSVVNNGTHAAQLTNAAGQSIQVSTALSGIPALNYTRFYFRFASLSGTTLIALAQDSSGHNQWIIYYDSGRQGLDIYFWNGAGKRYDVYSNANVLSANTWYSIEVEANQATNGHGEVWLNGNSIGAFDGDLSQSQSYGNLILDNEVTGTAYFDDVAVANSYDIPTTSSTVKLTPKTVNFGNQVVGTASSAQTVTLTNTGATALSMNSIAVTGTNASDFAQTNTCPSSLASNANCTISVTFTPGGSGARNGSITLKDSSVDSPQTIALSGTGVATAPAAILSSNSLSFGSVNIGTHSNAQTVTLTNSGTAALTISGIAVTGTNASDFSQTNNCPNSLAVSASCIISATFTPSASGARSANVSITDNAAGSPQTIALSGTGTGSGTGPTVYFSDGFESGNFSQWTSGTSGAGTATVQNAVVNKGTYAAQLTNAAGQSIQVSTALTGTSTLTYTRFYFRFASLSGVTLIALGQDSSGHNQWIIYYDNGRLDIYFWNGAGTRYDLYSNPNVVSANTWYSIEVETNQATNGHGEVWLNGTSIGAFDGDLSQSQSYGKLVLDNEVTGTAYFDDVVVSNGYNGPAS